MITGGDANLRDPPQFGFAFQFSAEVFSVRLISLLAVFGSQITLYVTMNKTRYKRLIWNA